jgi:hypothetical protein
LTLQRAHQALATIGSAFQDYALGLEQLASKEIMSEKEVTALAENMNTSFNKGVPYLDLEIEKNKIRLFSSAASVLFSNFLEYKRIKEIQGIVKENQESVESICDVTVDYIRTLAADLKKVYPDLFDQAVMHRAGSSGSKKKMVLAILDVNERVIDSLEMFMALEETYQALPQAHAALQSPQGDRSSLQAIEDLYFQAVKLQRIAESL